MVYRSALSVVVGTILILQIAVVGFTINPSFAETQATQQIVDKRALYDPALGKPAPLPGTVFHDNGVIRHGVDAGFSSFTFEFPLGNGNLFFMEQGIFRDGVISSFNVGGTNIVSPAAFLINNPPSLQRSQGIWEEPNQVRVVQNVVTASSNKQVLYFLDVTNISGAPINDLRIGNYADFDVENFSFFNDIGFYDAAVDAMVQVDNNNPAGKHVGISSSRPSSDHHLDTFLNTGNVFQGLNNPNNLNGPLGPDDRTVTMSYNLGSLAPGQTQRICLVLAAGDDLADFRSQIISAKQRCVGDIVKTVHAEKEVLVDLTLNRIKEVTIYAEIHENLNKLPNDPTINKQVEVVTCDKKLDEARVLGCVASTPPEDFGLINGVQNCIPDDLPLQSPEMNTVSRASSSDSQGMNTVVAAQRPSLIKTIDAQKEVFVCEQGTKIMDVVIFTEIFENLNNLPFNPVILKQFEVLTCLKEAATLTVESCVFSPTTVIFQRQRAIITNFD